MSAAVAVVYYGGFLVLFFFWIYGIVSFALDLKNTILPGIADYWRGRKERAEENRRAKEREDEKRGLY